MKTDYANDGEFFRKTQVLLLGINQNFEWMYDVWLEADTLVFSLPSAFSQQKTVRLNFCLYQHRQMR